MAVCVAQRSSKTLVACFPNNKRAGLSQIVTGVNLPAEGRQTFKNNNADGSVTAFHCVVTQERFYICAAKPDVSLGICYNFLADVQEEDQKGFESGNAMLGSLMKKWNKPQADKISQAKVKMDQIKSIMITNIDKARIRGEKLDELEMRAADIATSAEGFKASAQELKCKFIREKWKLIGIIAGVSLVLLIIIIIIIVVATPKSRLLLRRA